MQLPDRVILHDITFALGNADVSVRNALIDAANSIQSQSSRRPLHSFTNEGDLLGLNDIIASPTPSHTPASTSLPRNRYLVLPFASADAPRSPPAAFTSATTPTSPISVDVYPGFLGLLPLHSAVHAVFVTQVRRAGALPSGPVYAITKVSFLRLAPLSLLQSKDDRDAASAISKLLESGNVYYSMHTDVSNPAHVHNDAPPPQHKRPFHWNYPLVARLPQEARSWCPICIYGFVATQPMSFRLDHAPYLSGAPALTSFNLTLVSRRSRRRAGTRYITRGVDAMGDVANFVESEQIVWRSGSELVASFLIVRGSIPIFWRQVDGIARPAPQVDPGLVASRRAFTRHFAALANNYGTVHAVSLVDKRGAEAALASAYERHFDLFLSSPMVTSPPPFLTAFDFHAHCAGKEYERGLANLMDLLSSDVKRFAFNVVDQSGSFHQFQSGVFRVNCVDCLDRTNVVQSMIAYVVLSMQLRTIFGDVFSETSADSNITLYQDAEERFKHIWGDNADAVSKQYAGTGALKTDFTRTGKRSTTGVIGDGVKSVMRMYNKIFLDGGRQEIIDIFCSNVVIRPFAALENPKDPLSKIERPAERRAPSGTKTGPALSPSLWYSFEAMRINAGGDRQSVFVELHDEMMYVTTSDGISFEYPRTSLIAWSKFDNTKSQDRRTPAKLRLMYKPSYAVPATTYPLDLQFRTGVTMRENFLRALISWARPEPVRILTGGDVRVQVFSALDAGEHRLSDWGLDKNSGAQGEKTLITIVVPKCNATTRQHGLAAVPVDVDDSHLVVLAAHSISEFGPAIAVLASLDVARTTMSVDEAVWSSSASIMAGGAVAVAVEACGTSFCFVATRVDGWNDLSSGLTGLKLGRAKLDISLQFEHVWICGLMGDVVLGGDGSRPMWTQAEDGALCYSLNNGLSIMRYSLPTLRHSDAIDDQSLWHVSPKSSSTARPATYICLADGYVDGRKAPRLPQRPCKSVVTVTDLRAEDIRIPKGVDTPSLMTCSAIIDSEMAQSEPSMTRPTSRATIHPVWTDTLQLTMMPSDLDDVFDGFVTGQIVVPNVLGDAVVAGNFVVALGLARDGAVGFDVRCRIGGRATGRVAGRIHVDVLPTTSDNVVKQDTSNERHVDILPTMGNPLDRDEKFKNGGWLTPASGITPGKKSQLGDVNDRLDAARRKGARQMKSMVSRLSSLLVQPSPTSSTFTPTSDTSGTDRYHGQNESGCSGRPIPPTRAKSENFGSTISAQSAKTYSTQPRETSSSMRNGNDSDWWMLQDDAPVGSETQQDEMHSRWKRTSAPARTRQQLEEQAQMAQSEAGLSEDEFGELQSAMANTKPPESNPSPNLPFHSKGI